MSVWLLLRGVLRRGRALVPVVGLLATWIGIGALSRRGSNAIAELPAEILLPLLAAATARAVSPDGDSRRALAALVDRQLSPTRAALTQLLTLALLLFVEFTLGALAFFPLARDAGDPSLGRELATTLPVLGAAATAYASYTLTTGSFWRGRGLTAGVLADLLLGAAAGPGWFFPQGHLAALLGGDGRDLGSTAHFAWLYALALGYAALLAWRARLPAIPSSS